MSAPVFRDLGGIFQLHLSNDADLERIETLDKARWAATSAPIDAFECDPAFLAAVDTDGNRRIRLHEVRAARRWLWERLKDRSRLAGKVDDLRLADLDSAHADTPQLVKLGRHLLGQLGRPDADRITLSEVRQFRQEYVKAFPNGDGIVTAAQAKEDDIKAAIDAIVSAVPGPADLSGDAGVRAEDVDAYVEQAKAFVDWKARARGDDAADVLPLGDDTASAAALVDELAPKLDQFFAQCALLALEEAASERLAATVEQLAAIDVNDPASIDAWLTEAPVARPRPDAVLDLAGPLNTHYTPALGRLATDVGPRLLGVDAPLSNLTPAAWKAIKDKVAPHQAWAAARPPGIAADSDPEALQAFVDGGLPDRLRALAAEDLGVADELARFNDLEKLLLYQQWLLEFANNFVSFPRLFDEDSLALFQRGLLVMDGRKMRLAIGVNDRAGHKKLAEASLFFLAYLDLQRKDDTGADHKDSIVVGVTNGTRGGIAVGKRGVFYDRSGAEWDAMVTDLVVQPISLWEAMIAPFVRMRDAIAERIAKAAGSKAASLEGEAAAKTATLPTPPAAGAGQAEPPKPAESGGSNMQNLLIGGTLAFAAAASAAAFIVDTMAGIDPVDALVAVAVLVVLIMAVFGFLGWLKLRKRDLSTLLEAGGWALNGRMRITQYMAEVFTQRPGLPRGAVRRRDTKRSVAGWVVLVVVIVLLGLAATYAIAPDLFDAIRPVAPAPPAAAPAAAPAG